MVALTEVLPIQTEEKLKNPLLVLNNKEYIQSKVSSYNKNKVKQGRIPS